MKRKCNKNKLRTMLTGRREEVAFKAGVSVSLLDKLISNTYHAVPKEETRYRICKALGVNMEDLFPLADAA